MAASWECPSLPMLSLPLKETGKTSFLGLKPLIGAHYEENPDTFSDEIRQLDQLREYSTKPTRDYNGCSVLRRYFAQLHLLRARFPPQTVGQIPVDFAWRDVHSGAEYLQEGFQIEQASVLYNVAALHSQLGSHGKRDSEQEMKEAVTHFQCSAGALSYLDEHFAINHASKDLSTEFVSFYNSLMLGQAQECLVEKSLKGIGRVKNITISRLATRVSEFYSRCNSLLEGGVCAVIAKKNKDWSKLLKFKVFYYQSIAHYYQAVHAEEMGKYGELIALLQLTVQKLNSITGKPPKGMGDMMKPARQNFADHVSDKLIVARRQNEQVYHDPVPSVETLELMSGADLVKPVSFHPTDPKNLGTDIFSRLIPMRAHEVASIFSEEKAKLMRSLMSSVEEKDEELQQYMRSLNATEVEKIHEDSPTIPDNVLRLHQSLQGRVGEVRKLHARCQELMSMSQSVEEDFAAIRETKRIEEEEEEKFQSQFGVRPASQVCSGMWKEMDNYHGYNLQALKSNTELKAMFDHHYPNLVLLTSPLASLKASLPKMTLLDAPAEEASESERWQQLLKEVEKMTDQRQVLVARFRQQMSCDDITKNLVGHLGNDQEVFLEDHMRQFRELAAIIRQNLNAQENILIALTEANAKKASTRQTVQEIAQQQQAMFASLVRSGGFLKLLQTKIQEGIVFYQKLQASVSRLRKRSAEVCEARRRERQNIERQRGSTVPEGTSPNAPSSVPQPTAAPARPPKKAELAGKPLPPDQQSLPPLHGTPPKSDSNGITATPLNAHQLPPLSLDLQELQRIQMQQQHALLGGLRSPPPSEPLQLGNSNPAPNETHPSDARTPPAPQTPALSPASVPDAAQALNSLQMLLQSNSQLMAPQQGLDSVGGVGAEGSNAAPDPSLAPHRPPKPDHLKSGLLPSPFPSIPPPSEEQNTQPLVSGLAQPHLSSFAEGQPHTEPGVDTGAPQPGGLYPDTGSNASSTTGNLPSDAYPGNHMVTGLPEHEPQPSTTSTLAHPPPIAAEGSTSTHQVSLQDLALSQTQSVLPTSPPYHQTNINITPGEVTVATSSILGLIPSALAVPTASMAAPITSPGSSLGVQAPSMQPALSALAAADTGGHAPPAVDLPNLRDTTFDSASGSFPTSGSRSGGDPSDSQYTQSQDQTVTGDSRQSDTPVMNDDTPPAGSGPGNDQRGAPELQPISGDSSVSGISHQVSSGIPQTEPGVQTMNLPGIESQPGLHRSTTAVEPTFEIAPRTIPTGTNLGSFSSVPGSTDANLTVATPNTTQMSSASAAAPPASVSVQSDIPASDPTLSTSPASAPPSAVEIPPSESVSMAPVGMPSLPSVMPLPLTTLGSLTAPLEAPTDSTPVATELMLESLAPQPQQPSLLAFQQIQALQQNVEDQKRVIEAHRAEKEAHMKQEVAYQQQISQLQQQVHTLQMKQEQEKAVASDQQSALMKLLHQQQDMFSQQQSQMEKLSQQDESHRKEYLHVEEKFRDSLRVEQEMKVSLQSQILQLTQENQKLSTMLQAQSQQVQTLQLQLQQYNIHIQERDKQLVAFKDQHKEIVDKLEQRSQQRVAQLVQKIQELQLQVNQRPMLPPPPLQPTVVRGPPQQQNPQQNQDWGPAGLRQPNLPQPLQPNVAHPMRPPHSPSMQPPGVQGFPSRPHQGMSQPQPAMPVPRAQTTPPPTADPRAANLQHLRPSSSSQQQQPLLVPLVPMQAHPQNIPRPPGGSPTSQPPSTVPTQQQQQHPGVPQSQMHNMQYTTTHVQPSSAMGQVRPGNLPPSQQGPRPPSSGPHAAMPQSTPQTPSTPGGMGAALHPSRPASGPPLQSHASYPAGAPTQQQQQHQQQQQQQQQQLHQQQQQLHQQQMQMHRQPAPGAVFHSPSNPSLPQHQAMMPHPMAQQVTSEQQQLPVQQSQMMMGPRFPPQSGQMVRPGLPGAQQPVPTSLAQPSYPQNVPHGPPGVHPHAHHPQYHGHVP